MNGRFITIDGTEGAGKSTQLDYIRAWCAENQITAIFTREPGGTMLAENLRAILLDNTTTIDPISELLLLLAARRDHIDKVILPALTAGKWVISDRFSDATYAYQHHGRGIALSTLQTLEHLSGTDLQPDLRLIFGVSAETAAARLQKRGQKRDRFEQENTDFFTRVAEGYRARAATSGGAWIDCEASPEQVFLHVRSHLQRLL